MSEIVYSDPVLKSGVSFSPSREKKSVGPIAKTSQATSKIFVEKSETKIESKKRNYVYISVFIGVTALVAVAAILYLRGESFKAALQQQEEVNKDLWGTVRDLRLELRTTKLSESNYQNLYNGKSAEVRNKSAEISILQRDLGQKNSELESLKNERNNALKSKGLAETDRDLAIECATLRRESTKMWEQDQPTLADQNEKMTQLLLRCQTLLSPFLQSKKK